MVLRVVRAGFVAQFKEVWVAASNLVLITVQPLLFGVFAVYLFSSAGRTHLIPAGLIGAGLVSMWNACVFSSAGIVQNERIRGTLEFLFVLPGDTGRWFLVGKAFAVSLSATVAIVIALPVGPVVAGIVISIAHPGLMLATIGATLLAMTALGLLMGNAFVLSRGTRRLPQVFNYLVYIVSGLMFPLALVPGWLWPVSYLLAPTWAAIGLRGALAVDPGSAVWAPLVLLLLTGAYAVVAHWAYVAVSRNVRQTGSLHTY